MLGGCSTLQKKKEFPRQSSSRGRLFSPGWLRHTPRSGNSPVNELLGFRALINYVRVISLAFMMRFSLMRARRSFMN